MFFTVGIIFRTEELICYKKSFPFSNLQVEASSYFKAERNISIYP